MKEWQFDVLFIVGVIGALGRLFSDPLHIVVRPEVVTLFGVMLAYLYQQRKSGDKGDKKDDDKEGDA
jgi:hypothetical protein